MASNIPAWHEQTGESRGMLSVQVDYQEWRMAEGGRSRDLDQGLRWIENEVSRSKVSGNGYWVFGIVSYLYYYP